MGEIKLITVIPRDLAIQFIDVKRISNTLDTIPQVDKVLKNAIKECIKENIGYDNEPIAGLSRYNNTASELKVVGTSISSYIPTKPGSTLWELHMPDDMVMSMPFTELLSYNQQIKEIDPSDQDMIDMIVEDFKSRIKLGYVEEDDVISFIPFIDLKRCKFFALIDQSWSIGDFSVPGVEQVKLTNMHMF
jgi:hypothetical protein